MKILSSTDAAIAEAIREDSIHFMERKSPYDGQIYVAICDDVGLIEIANSQEDANQRINDIKGRMGRG